MIISDIYPIFFESDLCPIFDSENQPIGFCEHKLFNNFIIKLICINPVTNTRYIAIFFIIFYSYSLFSHINRIYIGKNFSTFYFFSCLKNRDFTTPEEFFQAPEGPFE